MKHPVSLLALLCVLGTLSLPAAAPLTNSLGMKFLAVPGTAVLFSIWETRVQDFAAFVKATDHQATGEMWGLSDRGWKIGDYTWSKPGFEQTPQHPVCGVIFEEARAFCRWLTAADRKLGRIGPQQHYRLPTDAEWSMAAGGSKFPWGDQWPPPRGAGNYADENSVWSLGIEGYRDGYSRTSPVGAFRANQHGLHDLGGNVREWCDTWYRAEMNTEEVRKQDPYFADDGGGQVHRVLRGAPWDYGAPWLLAAEFRGFARPQWRDAKTGFRCVLATVSAVPVNSSAAPWTNSLGMKFVPVPGTAARFCVWTARVQDFAAFVQATGYDATEDMETLKGGDWRRLGHTWKQPGFAQGPTHPVCGVSWKDAQAFAKWLTEKERHEGTLTAAHRYRLPASWEWSAAVGLKQAPKLTPFEFEKNHAERGVYPWGRQWPPPPGAGNYAGEEVKDADWPASFPVLNGFRDGHARTSPVGTFAPNAFGLYDMGGNVWQWCEDWHTSEQHARVLRGGSWFTADRDALMSYSHNFNLPHWRKDFMGFRLVLATEEPSPSSKKMPAP